MNLSEKKQQQNLIAKTLLKCRRAFIFASIFSFFISVFTLVVSIYSMQVLDRVLTSASIETLIFLVIITLFCLVFMGILTSIRSSIFLNISNWLDKKISPILLDSSIESQAKEKTLISQNLRDLTQIKNFIVGNNLSILFDAPFALIYLAVIFFIHPINGIITFCGALIMLKLAFINEKITHKLVEKTQKLQNNLGQSFSMISSNSEVIKAMGMKKNIAKIWHQENNKLQKNSSKLSVKSNSINSISKTFRMALQVITMASSAVLVIYNKMSSGGIIATSILAGKALAPFDGALQLWKSFILAKNSYDNLNKELKISEEKENKIKLPEILGNIKVEKLIFKPENSENILLKSLSFEIEAGQSIAIIGPSGSGKTSLAKILVGVLDPSSGFVRLDGANICDQNFEDIGDYIGYLPQDVELLSASVKNNISRMKNDDDKVIAAAKFCDIHELILKFDKGYETIIKKGGVNLSGGQKQLIALARAFYDKARFIVLDEPNSNLDSFGEAALVNIIKKSKEAKKTLILITHKPSIALNCDKIMVLKNGEIMAFDESEKVIKQLSA